MYTPRWLRPVVQRAMALRAAERFASAEQLGEALSQAARRYPQESLEELGRRVQEVADAG